MGIIRHILAACLLLTSGTVFAQVPWQGAAWTPAATGTFPSPDPNASRQCAGSTSDGGTITCSLTNTNVSTLYCFVITNASTTQVSSISGGATWPGSPRSSQHVSSNGALAGIDTFDEWQSSTTVTAGTHAISISNIGISANEVDAFCSAWNNSTGWDANVSVPTSVAQISGSALNSGPFFTSGTTPVSIGWGIYTNAGVTCGSATPVSGYTILYAAVPPTAFYCLMVEYASPSQSPAALTNSTATTQHWEFLADAID